MRWVEMISSRLAGWRFRWHTHWGTLSERERHGVIAAGGALLILVVWLGVVRPVWRTWVLVPAQLHKTESQWLRMRAQAVEAQSLQGQVPPSTEQARQALEGATQVLGSQAQVQQKGDQVDVTFSAVSPDALQNWLHQVRLGARVRPVEMDVRREPQGLSGRVLLQLPAAS